MKKNLLFTFFSIVMIAFVGCNRPETYIITFDANGGTGTMRSQEFIDDEAQALRENTFTRDGYSFSGWNTAQGGNGTAYSDGQTITVTSDMALYAQWTQGGSGSGTQGGSGTGNGSGTQFDVSGSLNGHDFVDLGLPSGLLWATCNVGANTPVEYGDYFAWGETTPKETYLYSTYKYCTGSYNTLTKYCNRSDYGNNGFSDNLTTLEASDDAATAYWGSEWRMPTQTELNELMNSCTVTCVTYNDVNGRLFTGPNGNSIFLPTAGFRFDGSLSFAGEGGCYWSSSLETDAPCHAWYLGFRVDANGYNMMNDARVYGHSVRPVCTSSQK